MVQREYLDNTEDMKDLELETNLRLDPEPSEPVDEEEPLVVGQLTEGHMVSLQVLLEQPGL